MSERVSDVLVAFRKFGDDRYELQTNLGMAVISTMNRKDFEFMLECLQKMKDAKDYTYYFPRAKFPE